MPSNDPMTLDLTTYQSLVSITSRQDDQPRWTELEMFMSETADGRLRFVCEVRGMSEVEGERTRSNRIAGGTTVRALRAIDPTTGLGRRFKAAVEDWQEEYDKQPGVRADVSQG